MRTETGTARDRSGWRGLALAVGVVGVGCSTSPSESGEADETTQRSQGRIPTTFTTALDPRGLQHARVAVLNELLGESDAEQPVRSVIETAVEEMGAQGADIVDVGETDLGALLQGASVIGLEFMFDFDAYLAQTPSAPVRSLSELIDLGLYHQVVDERIRRSLDVESLDTDDYRDRLAKRDMVRAAVEALLDEHDLTVAGDWTRFRAGHLYVDVHTTNNVPGLRADIESSAD